MSNEILGIILVGLPSMLAIIAGVVTAVAVRPKTKADATETTADAFAKMAKGMTDSTTALVTEITKLTTINNERQNEIDKMRADGVMRDKHIADLMGDVAILTASRDADEKQIKTLSDKVLALEKAGKAKDNEIESLKVRVSSQEELMAHKDTEISRLKGQIAELQAQHQSDAEKIRVLEAGKVATGEVSVVVTSNGASVDTLSSLSVSDDKPNPIVPLHGEGE